MCLTLLVDNRLMQHAACRKILPKHQYVSVDLTNGNGNGMGMGMKSLKWEGIGTKNQFPHTSSSCQSAAISKIVKLCCVHVSSAMASVYLCLFTSCAW